MSGGPGSRASVSSQADSCSSSARISVGTVGQAGRDLGIERVPRALADEAHGVLLAAQQRWKAASTATCTIRIGSGISSPFARRSGPWPSQRSVR